MNIKEVTKIDIGAGNNRHEGFTSVDLYNDSADIKGDLLDLPFDDGQIEEIILSHTLEHVEFKHTIRALTQCRRVLKDGGKLYIEVPDFEATVRDWLNSDEAGRWGHRFERIFGQQQYEGDAHKTGFTVERLKYYLYEVGFTNFTVRAVDGGMHHEHVIKAKVYK